MFSNNVRMLGVLFVVVLFIFFFFFSSRRRHTRYWRDWSSGVLFRSENCSIPFLGLTCPESNSSRWERKPAYRIGQEGIGQKVSSATLFFKAAAFQALVPTVCTSCDRSEERRVGKGFGVG